MKKNKFYKMLAISSIVSVLSIGSIIPITNNNINTQTKNNTSNLATTKATTSSFNPTNLYESLATNTPSTSKSSNVYLTLNTHYNSTLANNSTAILNTINTNPLANLNGFLNALLKVCVANTTFPNNPASLTNLDGQFDAISTTSPYYNFIMSFGAAMGAFLYAEYVYNNAILTGIALIPVNTIINTTDSTPKSTTQLQLVFTFNNNVNASSNTITYSSYSTIESQVANSTTNVWNSYSSIQSSNYDNEALFYTDVTDSTPIFNFYNIINSNNSTPTFNDLLSSSTLDNAFKQFANITSTQNINVIINQFTITLNSNTTDGLLTLGFGFINANNTTSNQLANTIYSDNHSYSSINTTPASSFSSIPIPVTSGTTYNVATVNSLENVTSNGALVKTTYGIDGTNTLNTPSSVTNNTATYNINLQENSGLVIPSTYFTYMSNSNNGLCTSPAICAFLTTQLFGANSTLSITAFSISVEDTNNIPNGKYQVTSIQLVDTANSSFIDPFALSFVNNSINSATALTTSVYLNGSTIDLTNSNISIILQQGINGVESTNSDYLTKNNVPTGATKIYGTYTAATTQTTTGITQVQNITFNPSNMSYFKITDYKSGDNGVTSSLYVNLSNKTTPYSNTQNDTYFSLFDYYIYVDGAGILSSGINYNITPYTTSAVTFAWNTASSCYQARLSATYSVNGVTKSIPIVIFLIPDNLKVNGTKILNTTNDNPITLSMYSSSQYSLPYGLATMQGTPTYTPLYPISSKTNTITNNTMTSTIELPFNTVQEFYDTLMSYSNGSSAYLTPSFSQWLVQLFFPNWFTNNNLTQIFYYNGNWISSFLIALENGLATNNSSTPSIVWTAPSPTSRQELTLTNPINLTYIFQLKFATSQVITNNTNASLATTSIPTNYNLAQILANDNRFSATDILNLGNLVDNYFTNNNLNANLSDWSLSYFYNYLVTGDGVARSVFNQNVSAYLSMLLTRAYYLNRTFQNDLNSLLGTSGIILTNDVTFSVVGFKVDNGVISDVSLLIKDGSMSTGTSSNTLSFYHVTLLNTTFEFTVNNSSISINISGVSNATDWMDWIKNWQTTSSSSTSGTTFPSSYFNDVDTLSFTPQTITFNNDLDAYHNNLSNYNGYAFDYNTLTGYLNTNSDNMASWCTWSSFSQFITTILNQVGIGSTNNDFFKSVTTLIFANVDFSGISPNTIFSNLLTWFPSLTNLTLQNCQISGTLNLNTVTQTLGLTTLPLVSLNINNNNLTSLAITSNMTILDASNNALTNIYGGIIKDGNNSNMVLSLPTEVFDVSHNDLASFDLNSQTIQHSTNTTYPNLALIDLSYNNLTSLNLSYWIHQSAATSEANSTVYTFTYPLTLNVRNNKLLSITNMPNFSTDSISFNNTTVNNTSLQTLNGSIYNYQNTNNQTFFSFDVSNQNAAGYWLYKIDNNSLSPLSQIANDSWWTNSQNNTTSGNGIPIYGSSSGYINASLGTLNQTGNGMISTYNLPTWFNAITDFSAGIIQNSTYENNLLDMNNLTNVFGKNPTTSSIVNSIMTNGNYLLNSYNQENSTYRIVANNGVSSSNVSFLQFKNQYDGIVPFNDASLYNILQDTYFATNTNYTTNELLSIYNQNFNLEGDVLTKYNLSSAPAYVTQYISANSSANNGVIYGLVSPTNNTNNEQVLIYNTSWDYYYLSTLTSTFTPSSATYSTIVLNNQQTNNILSLKVVLTNDVSSDSYFSQNNYSVNTTTKLSNVNQLAINNVWSLNGISGFYNLGQSGVMTELNNNPFDSGIYYPLYYQFMHITYKTNNKAENTLTTLFAANNSDVTLTTIGAQVDLIKATWGENAYLTFSNNLYTLLQQEGIIKIGQVDSLYGDLINNQFILSSTLLNSNLTLNSTVSTGAYFSYGADSTQTSSINAQLTNTDQSSFYQSSIWANFVNTQINIGTNTKPDDETIGAYLYNEGTTYNNSSGWNYEMPNNTNSLFNNATAKQAYDNILALYNINATNLTQSAFNSAISTYFPNLEYVKNAAGDTTSTNPTITLYKAYENYFNDNTLYTAFAYTNGSITNEYNFYTSLNNNSGIYALNLSYINKFSNIANTSNYLFKATIYGPSYFTNTSKSLITSNNIILASQVFNVTLTQPQTYSWSTLQDNEEDNLIPLAVYNNVGNINGGNSANWVPVQDFNSLYQTEHQVFVRNLAVGIVCGILVISILVISVIFIERSRHKRNNRVKEAKNVRMDLLQESRVNMQHVNNELDDDEWD